MGASAVRVRRANAGDEGAVLALLRSHDGLEAEFKASEFWVADDAGEVLACGRLRRHADGALELASVATLAGLHGRGLGSAVVKDALAGAQGTVFALALAPGFFARHGFSEVGKDVLPASVRAKAEGMCASRPFVSMARSAGR